MDLDPAAAVCTASLIQACIGGNIDKKKTVLLNITGGGYERVRKDYSLIAAKPSFTVPAGSSVEGISKELLEKVKTCV